MNWNKCSLKDPCLFVYVQPVLRAPLAKTVPARVHVSKGSVITSPEIALVMMDTLELLVTMVNSMLHTVLCTATTCSVLLVSILKHIHTCLHAISAYSINFQPISSVAQSV